MTPTADQRLLDTVQLMKISRSSARPSILRARWHAASTHDVTVRSRELHTLLSTLRLPPHPAVRFRSTFELVVSHGVTFSKVASIPGLLLGPQRACWHNARALACEGRANAVPITYYEGYARPDGLPGPIEHAWVAVDGAVVDPTWEDASACGYVGVALDFAHVIATDDAEPFLFSERSVRQVLKHGLGAAAASPGPANESPYSRPNLM